MGCGCKSKSSASSSRVEKTSHTSPSPRQVCTPGGLSWCSVSLLCMCCVCALPPPQKKNLLCVDTHHSSQVLGFPTPAPSMHLGQRHLATRGLLLAVVVVAFAIGLFAVRWILPHNLHTLHHPAHCLMVSCWCSWCWWLPPVCAGVC